MTINPNSNSNQNPSQNQNSGRNKYNLEERIFKMSSTLLELCSKIPTSIITTPLISQLVRSGTSIGANYMEANGCSSKRDFINKISIARKEAKETMYWIRLLDKYIPSKMQTDLKTLGQETHEFVLIFSAIIKNVQDKS